MGEKVGVIGDRDIHQQESTLAARGPVNCILLEMIFNTCLTLGHSKKKGVLRTPDVDHILNNPHYSEYVD